MELLPIYLDTAQSWKLGGTRMKAKEKKPYYTIREKRKAKWGYIFMLPWFVIFAVFYAYPLAYGIGISFTNFRLGEKTFIGLTNYVNLFKDYAFWRSLVAMLIYAAIVVPLKVIIPLMIANVIRPFREKNAALVKMMYYLPGVVSTVSMVLAWKFIFMPNTGIIAQLVRETYGAFTVFDDAKTSVPLMALLIAFTGFGGDIVVYSAALNAIPDSYYEAALLDGASRRDLLWKITVPLVQPTIVYVLVTATIASLQIFVIPQLLTAGGPNYSSSTLLMMVYQTAFINFRYGYAAAIGCILFVIIGVVAIIQFRVTKREAVEY